jgi:hypothetical protein
MTCAVLLSAALAASGCAGSTATDAGPPFCLVAAPIHASSRDTEGTRIQIDAHNAVGAEFCGW